MQNYEFESRVAEMKRRAHGQWTGILLALGMDEKILNRRNQPCPLCGGTDRFQYTDKYGEGNYHCRGCGAGGGLKLLQGVKGWDFGTILGRVEECVGRISRTASPIEPSPDRMKKLAKGIWEQAQAVTGGDEVDRYLRNRGLCLVDYPKVLRFHPALGYYEKDDAGKSHKVAEYPAMLACIQAASGVAVTLHRTYLKDGRKAVTRSAKKVLSAGINGAAVRLFQPTDELAVTEGIETALAVNARTGKPVWAAISAGNLERLWLPPTVRHVCIYADNDADSEYDGQACAFALARRLKKEEKKTRVRHVEVFVPRHAGTDWADVWRLHVQTTKQAA